MTSSIFSQAFPGDRNTALKVAQEETFMSLAPFLFFKAQTRYLDAARLLDVHSDLTARLAAVQSVPSSVLMPFYASIAAWFRFERYDLAQLDLFVPPRLHSQRLTETWETAFTAELNRLLRNDTYTRAMIELVTGPSERKTAPADVLEDLFEEHYGGLELKARRIHRLGSPSQLAQESTDPARC